MTEPDTDGTEYAPPSADDGGRGWLVLASEHIQAHPVPPVLGGDDRSHRAEPANVLLGADGTPFLETALLVPWLLKAGHLPAEAERWIWGFADKWRLTLAADDAEWARAHADAVRQWADYRLGAGQ